MTTNDMNKLLTRYSAQADKTLQEFADNRRRLDQTLMENKAQMPPLQKDIDPLLKARGDE